MLLPDPRRQGQIQFVFARSLPYHSRLGLILGLLLAGFALQAFVHVLVGAAALLAASLLGVVRGYSNVPDVVDGPREWRGAEAAQLMNVVRLNRKVRQWDSSALDITCPLGVFTFLAVAGVVGASALLLEEARHSWLARAVVVDAVVLLGPHWITGVRRILTNDPLVVKIEQLLAVLRQWESVRRPGETLLPQMQLIRTSKGELPCDAKLVMRIEPLGDAFLGLQVQVVLNDVQGKDYPYLYCVLVARPRLEMLDRLRGIPAPRQIIVEPKIEPDEDVEILVIRQRTTRTSGYHTKPADVQRIFAWALEQGRRLCDVVTTGRQAPPTLPTTGPARGWMPRPPRAGR